ncbi:MAG: F0F1 ATP synthase subunit A [Bacteroidota bacterium]
MFSKSLKSLLAAVFSVFLLLSSTVLLANDQPTGEKAKKIDPAKIILEHVADAHDFHFFTINGEPWSIPLPVILYSSGKGVAVFMSSAFHHGNEAHAGYRLLNEHFSEEHKLNEIKDAKGQAVYAEGKIYVVDANGMPELNTRVFDFSFTKNALQVFLSLILLVWMMVGVANAYKKGQGVKTAPSGFQNAVEPVITFVRDEVGKPNLGKHYEKYMPYLLTVFFFILINSLLGLIPGTANVSGNIAFTAMLGLIAFVVIMLNTKTHFWGHIANPPVPLGIKPIMIPVEILGIFTKPFALIIRLFANMISGHIIILSFICLIFVFGTMNTALGWGTSPFFVLLSVFIYLIEILVAFIQAFIFANLTAVFIGQAFEGSHGETEGHDDAVII